ncbi:MAG: type II 3-dehydroquinate dehydratase [Firmicutes bacterium]|nr:type II 3-dehydroquinate dehydratase [Bacillota bacterium]
MHILVINGPNLNLLGLRERELYGGESYSDLVALIKSEAEKLGVKAEFIQSNHEGDLVDAIQSAYKRFDGIIINPGAYTHTSIALLDALKAVGVPAVEVHITDPDNREEFRRISYIRAACLATIKGRGLQGYLDALHLLTRHRDRHLGR